MPCRSGPCLTELCITILTTPYAGGCSIEAEELACGGLVNLPNQLAIQEPMDHQSLLSMMERAIHRFKHSFIQVALSLLPQKTGSYILHQKHFPRWVNPRTVSWCIAQTVR